MIEDASTLKRPTKSGQKVGPLYRQIAERLAARIVLGEWREGHLLPPEHDLAKAHDVSVGTMRHALDILSNEGLLTRRPRIGTVVTGRSPHHTLRIIYEYFRLHDMSGQLITSRAEVLELATRPARAEEAERLRIAPRAPLVTLRRRRLTEDRVTMVDRIAIPEALVPGFPDNPADIPGRLYLHLLAHHGLRIVAIRENLCAAIAAPEDRALLGLEPDGPPTAILIIDEIAFGPGDSPILLAEHRALTDRHRYINEIR